MVAGAVYSAVLMVFCVFLIAALPVDLAVSLMILPLRSTVLRFFIKMLYFFAQYAKMELKNFFFF